jgi:Acetyltransferase (GNAT) domain
MHEIQPLLDPRWPELIARHPASSVFHTCAWLRTLHSTYGFAPLAVTTSAPGHELENALLFCSIHSWITGRRLVALPYSDHCDPLLNDGRLQDLVDWVKRRCDEGQYKYVELRPRQARPDGLSPARRFAFHMMDISPAENDLFARLDRKCLRNRIRHASEQDLTYEHGRSESLIQKWYGLALLTRRRHQLPPQPITWFRNLLACFGEGAAVNILSKDNRPIAGIVTLLHKQTVVCKYAASDQAFSDTGAMPLLFWRVILEAKRNGCRELDFGRSDPDNHGLARFKDHWGAARTELVYWQYPEGQRSVERDPWRVRAAKSAFSHMPLPILQASGRLLYKHFD